MRLRTSAEIERSALSARVADGDALVAAVEQRHTVGQMVDGAIFIVAAILAPYLPRHDGPQTVGITASAAYLFYFHAHRSAVSPICKVFVVVVVHGSKIQALAGSVI